MIRSLIRQLSQSPLVPSVRDCWKRIAKKGDQPDREEIISMLDDVVSDMPGDIFLVLDALDECPTDRKERKHLLSLLVNLADSHNKNIHILATSRPEQDINTAMGKFPSINLEQKLANDVETFVLSALQEEYLQDIDENIKSSIVHALLNTGERYVASLRRSFEVFVTRSLANLLSCTTDVSDGPTSNSSDSRIALQMMRSKRLYVPFQKRLKTPINLSWTRSRRTRRNLSRARF